MSNLLTRYCVARLISVSERGLVMAKGELARGERLQIMLSPEELQAVDDFRFKQRMPSRAAAVRDLFRLGLASVGIKPAEPGKKSGDFGVLDSDPAARDQRGGPGSNGRGLADRGRASGR